MIAILSTIIYILSINEETKSKKILQKGQAISKLNDNGDFQIYNFSAWFSLPQNTEETSSSQEEVYQAFQLFEAQHIYQINAKFSISNNDSIDLVVTTNVHLDIENVPISKPVVHLAGYTQAVTGVIESGFHLPLQVKPYLSSDQCGPFIITLLHPAQGRFHKSFTSAKKSSLVHCTGILMIIGSAIYCDILEFQFIGNRSEKHTTITVPWKNDNTLEDSKGETSSKKSDSFEKRISNFHQKISQSPPTPIKPKVTKQNPKGKEKEQEQEVVKVSEIAKSVLKKKRIRNASEAKDKVNEETNTEENVNEVVDITVEPIEEQVHVPNEPPSKRTRNKS